MASSGHTLRFLGTGASCGVPSFYCGCKACDEALKNPAAARSTASILISGRENTLIDASPDLRMQLSVAGIRDVHQLLLTHEHFDHIGGIPQLEYYVRLKTKKPLDFYAGEHTVAAVAKQFEYMAETLTPHALTAWQIIEFDEVRYTALPATHGIETFGFLIEQLDSPGKEGKRIAYFPDTGPLSDVVLSRLKGLDVLIIDATFNAANWMPESHLNIEEAITLAEQIDAQKTFLTHLAMHYDEPITVRELQEQLLSYSGRILVANDGLEIKL